MICFVVRIDENLEGFRGSVINKKCSLSCLVWIWKILEILDKYKNGFMLEKFNLSRNFRMHL